MHNGICVRDRCRAAVAVAAFVFVSFGNASIGAGEPATKPAFVPTHTEIADRSPKVLALLDEYYDFTMRTSPEGASTKGDLRFNDQLSDMSAGAIAEERGQLRSFLTRIRAFDRTGLAEADATDLDLLEYTIGVALDSARFLSEQQPITALSGPHIELPQLYLSLPLQNDALLADYATRLEKIPVLIRQHIANMRDGLNAGRVPPKVILAKSVELTRGLAGDDVIADPSLSPFYAPFRARPTNDPLSARAARAVREQVVPAFRELADFLEKEYIPKCRDSVGAAQGLDGLAAYESNLRRETTTNLTAQQIHEIGLKEVARIKAEMMRVIDETDWAEKDKYQGEEPFAKFVEFLRTDPRFYFTDEKSLLDGYKVICKTIDPDLTRLFGVLPRLSYGVRPIPRFAAPSSPAAYCYPGSIKSGVPGYFMVNTYDLSQRPRYGMWSLSLHESVPGHHFQLSIADELQGLHPYRTQIQYTSYVEGWALYSESLGLEMGDSPRTKANPEARGVYADPYDYFGRLSDEIWRACRLVVDTGMHAMGWTRQQAIDYMLANSAGTELDTVSEIDRYIGWPGQACAYKIGELKIRELRSRAENTLGDRFDVRAFHDEILGAGALPLSVLEKRIDRWIANQVKETVQPPKGSGVARP
ncbi:MAG: DUF885 domain-containing protein [Phycisphaeraceae bacterium]|nr:DUF885 domain-containing protein [Phycisphaeraceae bacterium]